MPLPAAFAAQRRACTAAPTQVRRGCVGCAAEGSSDAPWPEQQDAGLGLPEPLPPKRRERRNSASADVLADGSASADVDVTAVNDALFGGGAARARRKAMTKNHVADAVFEARWQCAFAAADGDVSKMPRCRYPRTEARHEWRIGVDAGGKRIALRFMTCVVCGVEKRCTTSNFAAQSVSAKGDIDSWLQRSEPGAESFKNCLGHPCNACWANRIQARLNTPAGWLHLSLRSYPRLRLNRVWTEEQARMLLCPVTVPKTLAEGPALV
jgi:hypothetical protein